MTQTLPRSRVAEFIDPLLDHLPERHWARIQRALEHADAAGALSLTTLADADFYGIRGIGPTYRRMLKAAVGRWMRGEPPLAVLTMAIEWSPRGEVVHVDCPCGKNPHPRWEHQTEVACEHCGRRFRVSASALLEVLV